MARYIATVVESLDLSEIEQAYAGRGSQAYHPAMLLSLLIYGYATGTFSSRQIERAAYDSLAFRYLACNRHPDHDTLATAQSRFGEQFESAFVQVLQVAHENQLSRFGTVSLDGTKIHAIASRHSALSYKHAVKLETQLNAITHAKAKSVMGFRQFLLRGLEKVGYEWTLECLAWNLKRMAVLRPSRVKSG